MYSTLYRESVILHLHFWGCHQMIIIVHIFCIFFVCFNVLHFMYLLLYLYAKIFLCAWYWCLIVPAKLKELLFHFLVVELFFCSEKSVIENAVGLLSEVVPGSVREYFFSIESYLWVFCFGEKQQRSVCYTTPTLCCLK